MKQIVLDVQFDVGDPVWINKKVTKTVPCDRCSGLGMFHAHKMITKEFAGTVKCPNCDKGFNTETKLKPVQTNVRNVHMLKQDNKVAIFYTVETGEYLRVSEMFETEEAARESWLNHTT